MFNFTTFVFGLSVALSAAVFSPTAAHAFTISKATVNNLGLVGHWTFDGKDVATGRSLDMSGNGNHGSLVGMATSTSRVVGKIGQALRFDGVDDYVNIGDPSAIKVSLPVTVSAWMRRDSHSDFAPIFSSDDFSTTYRGYALWLNASSQIFATYGDGTGNIVSDRRSKTGVTTLSQGIWYHVVAVIRGATDMDIYLNGVNDGGTYSGTGGAMVYNTNPARIGFTQQLSSPSYFPGLIDDVRIYSRALTAAEITALYNTGAGSKLTSSRSSTASAAADGLSRGLVGHWTFDGKDIVTGKANDVSGNDSHGILENMATSTSRVPGKIGQALHFDGVNDLISLQSVTSEYTIPSGGGVTASAWVKTRDPYGCFVALRNLSDGDPNFILCLGYNGGANAAGHFLPLERCDAGNSCIKYFTSTARVDDGRWHMLTAVLDQQNNEFAAYIDSTKYSMGQAIDGILTFDTITSFGAEKYWIETGFATSDQRYLNGAVDDVRFYNRALSQSEVNQLYAQGTPTVNTATAGRTDGLIGHWTFDGKDMVTGKANDMSGNGNHGTLVSMSTSSSRAIGKIGQALKFDGVDDYVNAGTAAGADLSGLSQITVGYWMQLHSDSNLQVFMGPWTAVSTGWHLQNETNLYRSINFVIGDGVSSYAKGVTPNIMTKGKWHYITAVFNGGGSTNAERMQIYVDGVNQPLNFTGTIPSTITSTSAAMYFGRWSGGTYFNGALDDVRIYNRAFSASEVKQLYNAGR